MSEKLRWGIIGTGGIAGRFASELHRAENAELVAVGSRRQETAEQFADEHNIPHRHGSYEDLAGDGDIDAVYISTPHPMHCANSILCLQAGKAVLCEKPFTVNAAQAEQVISAARENGVFCMEAMWTRFLPLIVRLREMLAGGVIGELRMVMADFGYRSEFDPASRLFAPELAGGALLDVGVYAVSLASMILGEAVQVASLAELGETGVDEQAAMVLRYQGDRLGVLTTAVRTRIPHEATIMGTDGYIRLDEGWSRGETMTLTLNGREPQLIEVPKNCHGFHFQVNEVSRCIAAGKTESDVMGLDESLSIMRTMDAIRAQWGLKYPME